MITGIVTGQDLRLGTPVIAADTINYITAQFVFKNALWDGLIKIAHFSNGEESADVELVDDAIRAEAGLNLTAGKWQLSLTGHEMSGGEVIKRITTVIAEFTVKPSGVQEGEPLPSLPSYGEQILAEVGEIQDEVDNLIGKIKNARDGEFLNLWAGSSAQYDAAAKTADTIYLIDLLGGGT